VLSAVAVGGGLGDRPVSCLVGALAGGLPATASPIAAVGWAARWCPHPGAVAELWRGAAGLVLGALAASASLGAAGSLPGGCAAAGLAVVALVVGPGRATPHE